MSLEMKLTEQIKQCGTVKDALLLIAAAVEDVQADIWELNRRPPADALDAPLEWDDTPGQISVHRPTPAPVVLDEVAALRAQLAETTDPDEVKVLNAKIALAKNPGVIPPDALVEGQRAALAGDDVVTPPPTEGRMTRRREFARTYQLHTFLEGTWTEEQAEEVFAKGGGRWLYYDGGRDAIMAMPYGARQWLCADIEVDSPAEAAEVARDILKVDKSVDQTTAVDMLHRMAEHGR